MDTFIHWHPHWQLFSTVHVPVQGRRTHAAADTAAAAAAAAPLGGRDHILHLIALEIRKTFFKFDAAGICIAV